MSDLDKLSDDELIALLNKQSATPAPSSAPTPPKEPIGFLESIPLGFKKSALGTIQTGLDIAEPVAEFLGAKDTTKTIKDLKKSGFDVEQQYREKGEGSGLGGFLGEAIGGAISPAGVAALATAPASGTLGLAWQGAKLGALTGATAPLEEGQSRTASGAIGAGAGAVLTPLTAKATAVLAKKANQAFNALRGKSPVIKSADELKALAEPLYAIKNAASQTALKPSAYGQAGLKLEKIAKPKGFAREQEQKSGKDAVYNFYQENLLPLAKRNITLDDFDVVDDAFQKAIDDVAPNSLLGKSGDKPAQARLMQMRQIFHDTIQSAPDSAFIGGKGGAIAWRQADRIKAAEYATRDLDTLIQKSMDKDQPAKAIQTGLAQILNSPRYSKAFNAKEKELMRDAIKTGVIGEGLRTLGSRLGALGALLTGGLETAAAVTGAGVLTREAAEQARVKGIDTVKQAITSRAIGTPMPVMPNVGMEAGAQLGKTAAIGAAQGISGQRGTPPEPTNTGLESLSDEELINLLNQGSEPTRINVAPPVNGQDPLQGTQGVPDVQLPATIPDTQPQASLLNRIMMAESSGRPMAMNDKSTAAGLFQFTDGTWNNMVKKYGDAYGITKADKMNPQAQQTMASLLLQENGNLLTRSLGRQLDDGDYYVAHVLGAPDAARVLKAHDKGKSIAAASLVGKGVPSANRGIFYDGNRPRSVREVVAILKNKVKTA